MSLQGYIWQVLSTVICSHFLQVATILGPPRSLCDFFFIQHRNIISKLHGKVGISNKT